MVKSISKIVQTLIDNDISIQDSLQRGYGNYSAIARLLQPKINKTLKTKVKLDGIITSVKRAKVNYTYKQDKITKIIAESVINIRTNISKINLDRNKENLKKVKEILPITDGLFFQIIEGSSTITLMFDQKSYRQILSYFKNDKILDKKNDLATIIIQSPNEIIDTPGCLLAFYTAITRRNINIEETMSCHLDTILLLANADVSKAFTVITEFIAEAKEKTN